MFFISKKKFWETLEEEIEERLNDEHSKELDRKRFFHMISRIDNLERRVNRLENPPAGENQTPDCQGNGVLPY